ncbi:peptide MFS transporter, partial [Bacillus cereus]|nr:peptide MFS transporter [Bacillus cereus]
ITVGVELSEENDPKRDCAFTIFYLRINIGPFLTPLLSSISSENSFKATVDSIVHSGFRYDFVAASIGIIIGLL